MALEYVILHHRQSMAGGHWDLVENIIPYRTAMAKAPQGDGSLCAALGALGEQGWQPMMDLTHVQPQPGETFMLLRRG